MKYQTLIIDGPYLAHRSYDAPYTLTTKDGRDATMIHSFVRSLNALRKQFNPQQILITWESHGTPSWRRELYPAYKPHDGIDSQFVSELKDLQVLLSLFDIKQFYAPQNEADDCIARLSINVKNIEYPIVIFSVDKDLMSLVGEQCHIYNGKQFFDINKVKEKFLVYPEQIPDLLAIAGDKADNIEGLKGYGFKKAAKILHTYNTIEEIDYSKCNRTIQPQLMKNKKLTKLNFNCPLTELMIESKETIESILDKYELTKMKEKTLEYKKLGTNKIEEWF